MKLPNWVRVCGVTGSQTRLQQLRQRTASRFGLPLRIGLVLTLPTALALALKPASSNAPAAPKTVESQGPHPVPSVASTPSPGAAASLSMCEDAAQVTAVGSSPQAPVHLSGLSRQIKAWVPSLTAYFAARPFPEIHPLARLARVPVMMYHDILAEKQVFFDVTPQEFEADLQLIQQQGLTPISMDQLVEHLSTGKALPEKPILLTFDDGYEGHYTYVYPLLKKYGYPAAFAIYPDKVGTHKGRSSLSWEQLREMARDPLVTIASHSVSHPPDLRELPDDRLRTEIVESKRILETQLGIEIHHFVYPEGKYDERVANLVKEAGYRSAFTMKDEVDRFAGESNDLLSIDRIGQSRLEEVVSQAYGGPPQPQFGHGFNFNSAVRLDRRTVDNVPIIFASGGKPMTIHANSRYQVSQIIADTQAVAAVDGGFFSLELLDSNDMIGPVYSQNTGEFVPANQAENRSIGGRPLVLIGPDTVKFIPYDPARHNTLEGLKAELPGLTDAFVAAAWLVKDGQPQPSESFGSLFDFDAARDRAFWGINQAGQPVVGVSGDYVDSVSLGAVLSKLGLRDVVMLDSGASASLVYQGQSMMSYEPRPVPHVVALLPPQQVAQQPTDCAVVSQRADQSGEARQ